MTRIEVILYMGLIVVGTAGCMIRYGTYINTNHTNAAGLQQVRRQDSDERQLAKLGAGSRTN